jgi:hypothetical protein
VIGTGAKYVRDGHMLADATRRDYFVEQSKPNYKWTVNGTICSLTSTISLLCKYRTHHLLSESLTFRYRHLSTLLHEVEARRGHFSVKPETRNLHQTIRCYDAHSFHWCSTLI